MRRFGLTLLLLVSTAAVIGLVWRTEWPLGVPGEWTWTRAAPSPPVSLTFASLAVAGFGYLVIVWLGGTRIERASWFERAVWLAALVLAGFGWLWIAQEGAPEGFQLSKGAWVLYSPGASGYFTQARADERPLLDFLRDYERHMAEGDVLHIGTHPPGLIVFFRGLLALCRASPMLTDWIVATEPSSVRLSLDAIADTARPGMHAIDRVDRAVLWLAAILAQGVAALTVIPLYGVLRRTCSPRGSWQAASLWPAVPAVAVFLPKSDAIFPTLAMVILWLWLTGSERRGWFRCFLAGATLWFSLCLSLAFLPIAFLAAVTTAWSWWIGSNERNGERSTMSEGGAAPLADAPVNAATRACSLPETPLPAPPRPIVSALLAAFGFSLPVIALRALDVMNLPAVWWLNLRNHAGFYRQFTRTYWKWLIVNPLEFALAAGLPLVCLALFSICRQWKTQGWRTCAPAVALAFTWSILWLSGKNMGEAARLWIFLTPCLIWLAGPLFELCAQPPDGKPDDRTPLLDFWSAALLAQLITCAAIVVRVVGFQYS